MSDLFNKNTRAYFLFIFFYNAVVFTPIYVLFEQHRGLNLAQVSMTVSVYYLTFFILEIPTGIFADKYGRKISLMFGAVLMVIGVFVCILANNFYHFAISEFIFASAVSFISGADSALIYDTLVSTGKQDEYLRIEGIGHTLGRISRVLSFILCYILTKYGLLYPYIATLGTMTVALIVTFAFKETQIQRAKFATGLTFWKSLYRIIYQKKVSSIFLYNALIYWMTTIGAIILYQPYFTYLGMPKEQLGLLYAGLNIVSALSASRVVKLINFIGIHYIIILLPVSFIVSFAVLTAENLIVSIIILIVPALAYGISVPVIKNITNRIISNPSERATLLSIQSLAARASFALIAPIVGFSMEKLGILASVYTVLTMFVILTIFIIPRVRKNIS